MLMIPLVLVTLAYSARTDKCSLGAFSGYSLFDITMALLDCQGIMTYFGNVLGHTLFDIAEAVSDFILNYTLILAADRSISVLLWTIFGF